MDTSAKDPNVGINSNVAIVVEDTPSWGSGRNARHDDRRDLLAGNIVTVEPFVMEQQVRPRHCDAQAMVHAARYYEFCEDAFLGWLECMGAPYPTLRASGVDLVISESRYRHRRPARLDDTLRIAVTGDAATQSSVVARFDVKRDQDVLATAEITYIAVKDGHRCTLPAPLQRLAAQTPSTERS